MFDVKKVKCYNIIIETSKKESLMNYNASQLLVWIDLETTGLDQDFGMLGCIKHKILEIGV